MARPLHGTFCWNELTTRDADTARDFYTDLLGWDTQTGELDGTPYTTLTAGEQRAGGLFQMTEEWGDAPSHWMAYIAVDDVDAAAKRVEALGGKVHFGPHHAPGVGRFIPIEDPGGAKISLITMENAEGDTA